jgi:hypothetical protein
VENERNFLIGRGKFSCFECTFFKREAIQTLFWNNPELASRIGKRHPQNQLKNTTSQPLKLREPDTSRSLDQNSESSSPPFRTRLNYATKKKLKSIKKIDKTVARPLILYV